MTVRISPAYSIVVRASEALRVPENFAPVFDRDNGLVVYGPFFDVADRIAELERAGLVFIDDFFDLPHSGGTVPDWCETRLELRQPLP